MKLQNTRKKLCLLILFFILILFAIVIIGYFLREEAMVTDFKKKNILPGKEYLFGTDWMGRDMFIRTIAGLSLSIRIGCLTAVISTGIAFLIGVLSAVMGKIADSFFLGMIDLILGIPHILLLILISFSVGKGVTGVVAGISLTHWMALARLIRGEVLRLKEAPYFLIEQKLGINKWKAAWKHMTPHLLPQLLTGMVLLFPHAILQEASITFLGFGLPKEEPAIGIILSESMKYLTTGKWWLCFFPGILLVIIIFIFQFIGEGICNLLNPQHIHQ